jgi:hypothetical protein
MAAPSTLLAPAGDGKRQGELDGERELIVT